MGRRVGVHVTPAALACSERSIRLKTQRPIAALRIQRLRAALPGGGDRQTDRLGGLQTNRVFRVVNSFSLFRLARDRAPSCKVIQRDSTPTEPRRKVDCKKCHFSRRRHRNGRHAEFAPGSVFHTSRQRSSSLPPPSLKCSPGGDF